MSVSRSHALYRKLGISASELSVVLEHDVDGRKSRKRQCIDFYLHSIFYQLQKYVPYLLLYDQFYELLYLLNVLIRSC